MLQWQTETDSLGLTLTDASPPSRELEETTRASLYHVAEHRPVRSESLQPHIEWSTRPGSEPPSVEADVYVWRYALLVVHARKKDEEEDKWMELV